MRYRTRILFIDSLQVNSYFFDRFSELITKTVNNLSIEIRQLHYPHLMEFIKFPWKIYRHDPNWVPPLLMERKEFLDPKKNPFFHHAEVAFFMAYRGEEAVGRIAAIDNKLHNDYHGESVGFFGLFECVNDQAVADALLNQAKEFLKGRGLAAMRGPANFSSNDEWGLLVDSFDRPPVILMTYNPAYYVPLLEKHGLKKVKDVVAHYLEAPKEVPERIRRGVELILKRNEFTVRKINMKDFDNEVKRIKAIYNAAWEKNWGFIPMTDAEFDFMAKQMKQIVDPDFILIAEHKGNPVAFSLTIPNLNEALIKIHDGKLFPFGLIKLLWHSRKGQIRSVRVVTLGITKEHRNSGIDTVFYHKCFEEGLKKGVHWAELSWILEDNTAMNRALERLGGRIYKTYRILEMSLN